LSQAEIGVGAIATLAWQCQIPPTCSRKREHGTPELRRDKALAAGRSYNCARLKSLAATGHHALAWSGSGFLAIFTNLEAAAY
jgi:hypothetical protein